MKNEKSNLPAQLAEKVKESGIQLNEAQEIASNYAPFMIEANSQAELLKTLELGNPEHIETAKRIKIDLGKICSLASLQKKSDKELVLIKGRFIDGLFNTVEGFARLTQKDAETIEKHSENLQKEALQKLKIERINELAEFGVDGGDFPALSVDEFEAFLSSMSESVYSHFLNGLKIDFQAKKDAEKKAENERIELQKKQSTFNERERILLPFSAYAPVYDLQIDTTEEDFKQMLINSEQLKKDSIEKQKKIEKQNLELKELAEKQEKINAEAQKKADEEKKRLELIVETQKKKNLELEKAEKERADAEKLENQRIEKEARDASKAPDIDKMIILINQMNLVVPELKDKKVKECAEEISNKFNSFKNWSKNQLKELK